MLPHKINLRISRPFVLLMVSGIQTLFGVNKLPSNMHLKCLSTFTGSIKKTEEISQKIFQQSNLYMIHSNRKK